MPTPGRKQTHTNANTYHDKYDRENKRNQF